VPISQSTKYSPVAAGHIQGLEKALSLPRLGPYLRAAGHDKQRALNLYKWNVMVGQSFYYPLQIFEVSLRNNVSDVLVAQFGKKWWRESGAKKFLSPRGQEELRKVRKRLTQKGISIASDDAVAALSFGFWTSLMAPKYKPILWSKHLQAVFPGKPPQIDQKAVYSQIDKALQLRNRIFHHEPLIKKNLSGDYSNIMNLLKWMCPDTQAWVKQCCSVPMVLRQKP
jgi:hypothetical protein